MSIPINPLHTVLLRLEEGQTRLEEGLARLRGDMMARLDRQQDTLTAIRDDIGVNMAATDRVREANEQTRKDLITLTEHVSLLHRRLARLEERADKKGEP